MQDTRQTSDTVCISAARFAYPDTLTTYALSRVKMLNCWQLGAQLTNFLYPVSLIMFTGRRVGRQTYKLRPGGLLATRYIPSPELCCSAICTF